MGTSQQHKIYPLYGGKIANKDKTAAQIIPDNQSLSLHDLHREVCSVRIYNLKHGKKQKVDPERLFKCSFLSFIMCLETMITVQVVVFLLINYSSESVGTGLKLATLSLSLTLIGLTLELRRRREE